MGEFCLTVDEGNEEEAEGVMEMLMFVGSVHCSVVFIM